MNADNQYKHLEYHPGRLVRQPYIKGIKIRADTIYSDSIEKIDDDGNATPGRTAEEIAEDRNLPLEAVGEAIDWCEKHLDVVLADRARANRLAEARGENHPDYKWNPSKYRKILTREEEDRILNDEDLPECQPLLWGPPSPGVYPRAVTFRLENNKLFLPLDDGRTLVIDGEVAGGFDEITLMDHGSLVKIGERRYLRVDNCLKEVGEPDSGCSLE
jgi:uncharacterized protein (DUF433 family)